MKQPMTNLILAFVALVFIKACIQEKTTEPAQVQPLAYVSGETLYHFDDGPQGLPIKWKPTGYKKLLADPAFGDSAMAFGAFGVKRSETKIKLDVPMDEAYTRGFYVYINQFIDTGKKTVIYQTHKVAGEPGFSPIFGIRFDDEKFYLTQELDSGQAMFRWEDDVVMGEWVKFDLTVFYTVSDSGFVRFFYNDSLVYSADSVRTLIEGATVGPDDRIGFYHGQGEAVFDSVYWSVQ